MTLTPTPPQWPGSVRLGTQTYLTFDGNTIPDTTPVTPFEDVNALLDEGFIEDYMESYATLSREYYMEQVDG